jgi:cytochrome c553
MIRVMTPQERISTVLFYSRQNVPPRPGDDADRLARGKAYFNKVCFRCHGPDGRGNEDYARLAGQQPSYMTLALQRYRNNSDGMRNDPMMADVVKMMNDADISAVAAYVASLP